MVGEWGVVLGWPAFMSVIVITAVSSASPQRVDALRPNPHLPPDRRYLSAHPRIIAFSLAHDALAPSQQAHALSQSILPGMYVR